MDNQRAIYTLYIPHPHHNYQECDCRLCISAVVEDRVRKDIARKIKENNLMLSWKFEASEDDNARAKLIKSICAMIAEGEI